jgi:centromeric protein E
MEGYHGTVFAYGMTGTGKTFSMQGTATSPGVIPLAITDIFSFIRETPHREFLLRVSYLEIYNEKIHDLLSAPVAGINGQPTAQDEIKLREDSKRGVYASPLKEEIVQSPTQLLRVIARGDAARRVAGTMYNARSSRSHAVVQIVVESRARAAPTATAESARSLPPGGVRVSTLSLIDLAGSERAAETKERRTEGAHINKSLLTLGTVISKLSGDKTGNSTDKDKHLPYRDSKLTRLLQGALSGDSLVSILCTIQIGAAGSVATAQNHTIETLNTLKFASRAKNNIVSHAKKADEAFAGNDPGSRALLERYRVEISDLRRQLDAQGKTGNEHEAADTKERDDEAEKARELQAEQRHEEQMLEMQLARTALKERIEHLNRLILSSRSLGVNNAARSFSSQSTRNADGTSGHQGRSARSSTATLEDGAAALRRTSSATGSMRSFRQSGASVAIAETPEAEDAAAAAEAAADEEEDSLGSNGDGTAPMALQVRALQADLSDKNRYIQTLEKRLLQARRSSHSRVSMQFSPRFGSGPSPAPGASPTGGPAGGSPACSSPVVATVDEAGVDALLRDKDAEISDLRARLDDKERMVRALREAQRKRDVADLGLERIDQLRQQHPPRAASAAAISSSLRRRSAALATGGSGSASSPRASLTGARSATPLGGAQQQQQGRMTPQPAASQARSVTPQPLQPAAKKEQAPAQPKQKDAKPAAAAKQQDARSSSGSGSGSGGSATSSGVFMAPAKGGAAAKGAAGPVAAPTIVTTAASSAANTPAATKVARFSPVPSPVFQAPAAPTPTPIVALPPMVEGNRRRSVDEMTRLLDEMITERVQGAAGKKGRFAD